MIFTISNALTAYQTLKMLWTWKKEGDLTLTHDIHFKLGLPVLRSFTSKCGLIHVDELGDLTIKTGFLFNGCSNVPDGPLFKVGSSEAVDIPVLSSSDYIPMLWESPLIHDALYQLLVEYGKTHKRSIFTRKNADRQLKKYMKKYGEGLRGSVYYRGLRVFGGRHIRKLRDANK